MRLPPVRVFDNLLSSLNFYQTHESTRRVNEYR